MTNAGKARVYNYFSNHEKTVRYDGRPLSYWLAQDSSFACVKETDSWSRYNRSYFNALNYDDQKIYEENLSKKKNEYTLHTDNDKVFYINKTLFDYISLEHPEKMRLAVEAEA